MTHSELLKYGSQTPVCLHRRPVTNEFPFFFSKFVVKAHEISDLLKKRNLVLMLQSWLVQVAFWGLGREANSTSVLVIQEGGSNRILFRNRHVSFQGTLLGEWFSVPRILFWSICINSYLQVGPQHLRSNPERGRGCGRRGVHRGQQWGRQESGSVRCLRHGKHLNSTNPLTRLLPWS